VGIQLVVLVRTRLLGNQRVSKELSGILRVSRYTKKHPQQWMRGRCYSNIRTYDITSRRYELIGVVSAHWYQHLHLALSFCTSISASVVSYLPFQPNSQSHQQRAWLDTELFYHPILPFQTPEDWLLWRTKVSEGMSEEEGWQWVQREAILKGGHMPNGGGFLTQPTEGVYHFQYSYPQGERWSPLKLTESSP